MSYANMYIQQMASCNVKSKATGIAADNPSCYVSYMYDSITCYDCQEPVIYSDLNDVYDYVKQFE